MTTTPPPTPDPDEEHSVEELEELIDITLESLSLLSQVIQKQAGELVEIGKEHDLATPFLPEFEEKGEEVLKYLLKYRLTANSLLNAMVNVIAMYRESEMGISNMAGLSAKVLDQVHREIHKEDTDEWVMCALINQLITYVEEDVEGLLDPDLDTDEMVELWRRRARDAARGGARGEGGRLHGARGDTDRWSEEEMRDKITTFAKIYKNRGNN